MNIQWLPSATLAVALCLAACNATQARINDNEELFSSYSPQVQAMIQSERIDHGFDTTQVYLTFGNADRTESQDGQEIWYYHRTHKQTAKEQKSASDYRDEMTAYENAVNKGYKHAKEPTTSRTFTLTRTGVERLVRFEDGVVVSWEEPEDMWLDDWHR